MEEGQGGNTLAGPQPRSNKRRMYAPSPLRPAAPTARPAPAPWQPRLKLGQDCQCENEYFERGACTCAENVHSSAILTENMLFGELQQAEEAVFMRKAA